MYIENTRTSYGLPGIDIKKISDESCKLKILSNEQIENCIKREKVEYLNFKGKWKKIDWANNKLFKSEWKGGNNYFIHHGLYLYVK